MNLQSDFAYWLTIQTLNIALCLRPNSSNLPCLYSTFHLEYPLVLSRFYFVSGTKLRYNGKGIVSRNTHVQYESPFTFGKKVLTKVKVFKEWVKLQGQGHEVKNYSTMWKDLSQEIHMCNMKALSLLVRKFEPRFKFLKSGSNFKVKVMRSKITVPCERYQLKV